MTEKDQKDSIEKIMFILMCHEERRQDSVQR